MSRNAEIARKIRDAIFAQAEADGRVMHGDSMDRVIEGVLNAYAPPLVVRLAKADALVQEMRSFIDCQDEPVIYALE